MASYSVGNQYTENKGRDFYMQFEVHPRRQPIRPGGLTNELASGI